MIVELKVTYDQEADCCDGTSQLDTQYLEIELHDGGGGEFWTLKTERWAIDDVKDLGKKLKTLQKFVNASKKKKDMNT